MIMQSPSIKSFAGAQFAAPGAQFATKSVRGPICLEPVYSNNIETQLDKIYI